MDDISHIAPNKADIFQHLEALFHPRYELPVDTWFEIVWGEPVDGGALSNSAHFTPMQLREAAEFAFEKSKAGNNVYVSPGLRKGVAAGKNNRANSTNFARSNWTWAEFDGEGDELRVKGILEETGLKPDTLVLTGAMPWKRIHLYFRLEKAVTSVDELKAANVGLQKRLVTDPAVTDPIRIMRLGGTVNHPTPKKIARGYIPEVVRLYRPPAPDYTPKYLAELSGGNSNDTAKPAAYTEDELAEFLKQLKVDGKAHNARLKAVGSMIGKGWSDEAILIAFRPYDKEDAATKKKLTKMLADLRRKNAKEKGGPGADKPIIRVEGGNIAKVVDAAEVALIDANRPIFERAQRLVIPITSTLPAADDLKTDVITFKAMQTPNMVYALNKYAATFEKWDGRSKEYEVIDPPVNVASTLLAKGEWDFPVVTGVITTPTMRSDGTLIDAPGYDEKTQLLYRPDRQLVITPIKEEPTKDDAIAALELLLGLLAEFPFVTDLDKSVAVSGLMTPVLRGAFDVGPLIFVRAHAAGSGKTFLINLISRLLTARPAPVIEEASNNEELGKRLDAAIFQGWQIVCIDNCLFDIGGAKLCQVAEQQIVGIRILGKTEIIPCEWRGSSFATGNNVGVTADMTRRTLYCNLDPKVDRPENRVFDGNPVDRVLADRWKYIAAVLTIARAWRVDGSPIVDGVPPIASYEKWARAVRYPLIWLGMEDPVKSMEEARAEDPERIGARALLSSIRELFKEPPKNGEPSPNSQVFVAADLVKKAGATFECSDDEKLQREALHEVLRTRCEGDVTSIKVGMWLKAIKGQVHDGHRLMLVKDRGAYYRVEKCS